MDITQENKEEIITLLNRGICPLCGKYYKVILTHISMKHGIKAEELKDKLLLSRGCSFLPEELRKKHSQHAIENNFESRLIHSGNNIKPNDVIREKLSNSLKTHYHKHPEHLQAFQEGRKKAQSKAVANTIEACRKAVVRISPTNEHKVYGSIADAERDGNTQAISYCIKHNRKDSCGNRWILLINYNEGDAQL